MRQAPRSTDGKLIFRWLPLLERLETREVPAVTAALSQAATWTELGPNVISGGQVRNMTSPDPNSAGNISNAVIGAISTLAPHPTDPNIMFAGTPNGGVWRTTNALSTNPVWVPLTDGLASMSVADITFDPTDPTSNRMVVGIGSTADGGEVETTGRVRGDLVGLLVTDNALAANPTWRIVGGVIANRDVVKATVRGNTMLVATTTGLFRSTDGGVTFTNVFSSTVNNGVTYQQRQFTGRVYDLAVNSRVTTQFYIATEPFADRQREIWRTDDGGLTWGTVTDYGQMQLSTNTTSVKISVRDVAALDNQVYVAVVNTLPTNGAQQFLPGVGAHFGWDQRATVVTSINWSTNQGGNWTRMDNPRRLTAPQGLDLGQRAPQGGTDPFEGGGLQADGGRIRVVAPSAHRLKTGDWIYLQNVTEFPPTVPPNAPPTDLIYDRGAGNFFQVEVIDGGQFYLTFADGTYVPAPGQLMDSKRAFWQRVVDATPGESGLFGESGFMDIVAAPSDPLLANSTQNNVYLGGDFSQFRFDPSNPPIVGGLPFQFTQIFPESYTGSVWRGNRFTVPDGDPGAANQWANMTDEGTAGTTAPGGDTREMVFDANGNLWVATGTGVYRRTSTGNANWVNASGNIRAGQFWGVGYDTFNNLAFGSTQDTGMIEQTAGGGAAFNQFNTRGERNTLIDQEYAYEVAVDNTSSPGQSIRYFASSNFGNIRRRVYNSSGVLISNTTLNLANALTTTAGLSGIAAADVNLFQDSSARIVMELNNNDQRRGVYGLTRVYEDSDPLGPGGVPVTGFVVSDVTPNGMNGRVRSMAYGGKRAGINFNQVFFFGTTSGQLFIRGEFGTTFTETMAGGNGGPVIGSGPVTDIQLDPDDYRHAFVAKGGQVYETRDLGVSWTLLSNGLVGAPDPTTGLPSNNALTTQIYTIALYDPNPGTANVGTTGDVVLLAGGRGGVFRRTLSVCGTTAVWSEYGNGLPNTVVTDMEFYGNRLVAGTFGRGSWTINDVNPTLTQTLFLDIIGDAAANNISIQADPLDPNAVIVSDGLGLNQRFSFGQFDAIRVFALGGADTVVIDGNGPAAGGTLQFINYPVSVNLGGDAGDQLVLGASGTTYNVQATIGATTIGGGVGDNLFSGCGSITYAGLQAGTLTLRTGSGTDNIYLVNGPLPQNIALDGDGGYDTYYMNSAITSNVFLFDSSPSNAVAITVPAGQPVFVDAPTRTVVAGNLVLSNTPGITSVLLDAQGTGSTVNWSGSNAADHIYLMQDPGFPSGWSQLANNNFYVRFRNMLGVTVNALGGTDILQVDSNGPAAGGDTLFMNYLTVANMGGQANDTLLVDTSSRTTPIRAGVTGSVIGSNVGSDTLFGGFGSIQYSGLNAGGLYLYTGQGNDQLYFDSAAPLFTVVYGGGGTDEVWALGTAGNDVTNVVGSAMFSNALRVAATIGVEQFGVTGGGGGTDYLFTSGTAGNDALSVTQTGLQSGTVGGIPVPTTFLGVQAVSVNGVGGTDSFDWTDTSNVAFGSPINPTTGLVFAPTGPTSANFILGGAAGTFIRTSNIAGTVTANGSPSNSTSRDVITVLAASSAAAGATDGELVVANGSDTITATENGVSITNASIGALRGINFGRTPGGLVGFSTVYVKTGNEVGTGDTVFATATNRTNLLIDGGAPSTAPGDSLTVTTNGPASSAFVSDPSLGPPHTRITSRGDQSAVGHLNFESVTALMPDPNNPGGPPISSIGSVKSDLFAAGSDGGITATVRVYNLDGSLRFQVFPFGGFTGAVKVAVGDVTGDGKSDVVVAAGASGGPIVKVYDGQTQAEVRSFFAYDPAFTGGVNLAVGNFDSDAFADIVTGAGSGGAPHVKLFDGATGAEELGFYAYGAEFTGGVTVGAGDVNGDGLADFITGAQAGGAPHVRAFNGQTTTELLSFFAFDPGFAGGVNVSAGDVDGDGRADVIVGAGPGGPTQVRVFNAFGGLIRDFVVNDPTIPGDPPIAVTGGVRVAAADFDNDGLVEIVTGRGRGSRPFAQVLKVSTVNTGGVTPTLQSLLAVNVFGDAYSNGIYVGT